MLTCLIALSLLAAPDDPVARRVDALLNSIDTPVSVQRWRQLGATAEPRLVEIIDDAAAFPSRRSRAVVALAYIDPAKARDRARGFALDETQPVVIRLGGIAALDQQQSRAAARDLAEVVDHARAPGVRVAAARKLVARSPQKGCSRVAALSKQVPYEMIRSTVEKCEPER